LDGFNLIAPIDLISSEERGTYNKEEKKQRKEKVEEEKEGEEKRREEKRGEERRREV